MTMRIAIIGLFVCHSQRLKDSGAYFYAKIGGITMNERTKKLTTLAMLCALAYVAVAVFRIPVVLFLKYDPKDVIIAIGGFIYGPLPAFIIALLVSFVEMLTLSGTGIWGFMMNVLSSTAFAVTAAWVYKREHSLKGAVKGLVLGVALMVSMMLLWNYIVTPIYMGRPRQAVAAMLLPYFLPFNLLKGSLNAVITMLLYKPIVQTLRRAALVPAGEQTPNGKINAAVPLASALVLVCGILVMLILNGTISL